MVKICHLLEKVIANLDFAVVSFWNILVNNLNFVMNFIFFAILILWGILLIILQLCVIVSTCLHC